MSDNQTPRAFIQWKGTDVCMDFHCTCGEQYHFDGFFAYAVKCNCGKVWEMPDCLVPTEITKDNDPNERLETAKHLDFDDER
jgi:hypothetical protein